MMDGEQGGGAGQRGEERVGMQRERLTMCTCREPRAWSSWRHHVRVIFPSGLTVPGLRKLEWKECHRRW